jgi:hypothetical protein
MAQLPAKATTDPEFIRFVASTYKDDLYGYRRDILGRAHADWQQEVGLSIQKNKRTAVAAGHGIGKTGFAADVIHWFLSTRPNPAIVATANTETQLRTKLWRELAKINAQARNKDWFEWKTSTFTMFNDPTAQAQAIAWSEENPEAFAGTHENHVLGIFDEASRIARNISNTFAGAMTTAGARWVQFGNSTRNEGYFYDICHGSLKARKPGDIEQGKWNSFVVPSWESPFVDKGWVAEMKATYGEESDEYRIRVAGLPPRSDPEQFISRDIVGEAMARQVELFSRWPLIIGCDVGRGDRSVMVHRRGRKVLDAIKVLQGERTTDFARRLAEEIRFWREDEGLHANMIIEELGMGVGVVETLQDMGFDEHVWGVNTGAKAYDSDLYVHLREEMWFKLKEWLEGNVELPNHKELMDDLVVIRRRPNSNGKLRLETKEEMRRRGVKSPDVGDALALTFAVDFSLLPERRDGWADAFRKQAAPAGGSWMSNSL